MSDTYLPSMRGGKWAISRRVNGKLLALVQDSYLDHPDDAIAAMHAAGIPVTSKNIDKFFPYKVGQGRCPTLEFLEIFSKVGKAIKQEVGV